MFQLLILHPSLLPFLLCLYPKWSIALSWKLSASFFSCSCCCFVLKPFCHFNLLFFSSIQTVKQLLLYVICGIIGPLSCLKSGFWLLQYKYFPRQSQSTYSKLGSVFLMLWRLLCSTQSTDILSSDFHRSCYEDVVRLMKPLIILQRTSQQNLMRQFSLQVCVYVQ